MNLCTKANIECQSHIYPIPISTTDKHMSTSLACTSSTVVVWQHQWLLDWCFVSKHNCMDYYIMQFQSEHYTYWLIVFYQLCSNIVHWNCSPGQNLLVESAHNRLTNHVPREHNTLADSVPLQQKISPPHTYTLAHTNTHAYTHAHTHTHICTPHIQVHSHHTCTHPTTLRNE